MDDLLAKLGDVSETLLLPFYARVIESGSKNPILRDPLAVEIAERLDGALARSEKKLHQKLLARKMPPSLVVSLSLRTLAFDRFTADFLARFPGARVVSMGCGLDTRHARVKGPRASWFDLDLPAVMELRNLLVPGDARRGGLSCSVTDHSWIEALGPPAGAPHLFLAEGLFMYLPGEEVRALVLELSRRFPGSELVAEVFSARWLKWMGSWFVKRKFRKQLNLSEGATFKSGLSSSEEMESWGPGIHCLGDWTFFDERHPKLGLMNLLGRFESLRRTQWVVRYGFGDRPRPEE